MYCYKVKHGYLKVRSVKDINNPNGIYADIEKYGFIPVFEKFQYEDELENVHEEMRWAKSWAKNIKIPYNSSIGSWAKKNIEAIYKKCKKEENVTWLEELSKEGYEFDENGALIETDKVKEYIDAQLIIFSFVSDEEYKGILFINVSGQVEFINETTLLECAKEDVESLLKDNVIYRKKFIK